MDKFRGLLIPQSWRNEAMKWMAGRQNPPCYQFIWVPDKNTDDIILRLKLIKELLKSSTLGSILYVLPKACATPFFISKWPKTIIKGKSGYIVSSVYFADQWRQVEDYINQVENEFSKEIHATCQYQFCYTETLNEWVDFGAKNYHPGDFRKGEFLSALKSIKGHWIYWGHAHSKNLGAYGFISIEDLMDHRPKSPFQSTIWLSCATLVPFRKKSIALDWFISGSTHCLFASTKSVQTTRNMSLSKLWLELISHYEGLCIADLIKNTVEKGDKELISLVKDYRLLGYPWSRLQLFPRK
ncbi:hypothetical protein M3O96_00075 [Aquiflexum sp. TKW24L]|uniref:hypothetical protein n=1 Tax=Aquiflexum sp. TKW24L TaxID=2942212 RepID=UPI0020BFEAA6|nr:hypothetical protein [Aquiflexum sp. TKW24L]MCL6257465.1 hypothetical protein [Aquiflexum sp. TKW24L]